MNGPLSENWICQQQADALDVLAETLEYGGFTEAAIRFSNAADILRQDEDGSQVEESSC